MDATSTRRGQLLQWGILLAAATIAWNVLEGFIAVTAGLLADSVALLGFGIDSFIEVTSAGVVLWRLVKEKRGQAADEAERLEKQASRIAGALLFLLAAYIAMDATRRLAGYGEEPQESLVGVVLTAVSLVVMPALGWAKLRTARSLNSRALRADAFETIACAALSLTTLVGLSLNVAFGWAWADPAAALLILPILIREGREAWRGECCGEEDGED